MKFLILSLALIAAASAASISDPSLDIFWEEFKTMHNKEFLSMEEETLRYKYIKCTSLFFFLYINIYYRTFKDDRSGRTT